MALSDGEIAIIKGMLARGDRQSDIAAYFGGSNGGRVSEINTGNSALGRRASTIAAASSSELPPPGPYFVSGRAAIRAKETLAALRDLIDQTLEEINNWEASSKDGG
ncbi:hypothetical protein AYJ54_00625 [Bradyrhizobium centrolobii]|uniref:Uncharacterized protein n=1 Tax=Bradyrhizobium centrolobii TaxID=1505087 RepID=A0A176YFM9_9BRAD|nr:hypothetical protein [Bradyrhizobium centrolobii]OAF05443.1 hypothetical protein AYJ54_00625 [Bradyrhizobium centrolobii]